MEFRRPQITLWGVAGMDQGFAAVGNNGTILTSPDGAVWHDENSNFSGNLLSVADDGRTFVSVGESGTILESSSRTPPILEAKLLDDKLWLQLDAVGWEQNDIESSTDLRKWVPFGPLNASASPSDAVVPIVATTNLFFRARCSP